ncbi:hypothetical protein [Candidatus Poriferisodalis sp.]|uniref:hypothetical protein n=1 Tax=Candidatus Poriferisodalis sp. TaxID=3101277 RepID=UPI003B029FAD
MSRRARRIRHAAPSVGELMADIWDEHRSFFAVYRTAPDSWRQAGRDVRAVAEEVEAHLGSAVERYAADHSIPAR